MTIKSFRKQDLIRALKTSGSFEMGLNAAKRTEDLLLAEARRVTVAPESRYSSSPEVLFVTLRPMFIPIAILIVLLAGAGTAVASNSAKPGDWLWGVDRAVEQVQLKLTTSSTARAELLAKQAVERAQEAADLEEETGDTPATEQAKEHTDRALEQARETIDTVQAKMEEKGNDQAAETLQRVEDKLQELKTRHDARFENDETPIGLTEAEATINNGIARVRYEFNDKKTAFQMNTASVDEIAQAIADRTGLTINQVKAILTTEVKDDDDDQNSNSNSSPNTNSIDNDDEEDDSDIDQTDQDEDNSDDLENERPDQGNRNEDNDRSDQENGQEDD